MKCNGLFAFCFANILVALAKAQEGADVYENEGIKMGMSGNYVQAINDFSRAIKLAPTRASLYVNRSFAKLNAKDYGGALADSIKAIQLDPTNSEAFNNQGVIEYSLGHSAEAIKNYDKAIALAPDSFKAYGNRGLVELNGKDFLGAITDCSESIQLNPRVASPYHTRGDANFKLGRYAAAIIDYTAAIDLDKTNVNLYNNRGSARAECGDWNGSIADYTKAIQIDSGNAILFCERGKSEFYLQNYTNAILDLNVAIELNPRFREAYEMLGHLHNDTRNFGLALRYFQKALDLDSTQKFCLFQIWLISSRLGQQDAATKDLVIRLHFPAEEGKQWPIAIGRFLIGEASENELFVAAKKSAATLEVQREYMCEANYYVGMRYLISGDKGTAADFFAKALDTGEKRYFEYLDAEAELHDIKY